MTSLDKRSDSDSIYLDLNVVLEMAHFLVMSFQEIGRQIKLNTVVKINHRFVVIVKVAIQVILVSVIELNL